ncbi:MAG TPA: amidohydrolase family protein [Alphaproteobacteria bacterium]|jgi:N-acyl-D-aspartate/D-glutamate deacylase|nr:amidohydrolase family protein [Alphaproteobacteria bacterium]
MSAQPHDYDLIIRNGYVVDGSGLPRRRVDVGIRDGKVARMAHLEGRTGAQEIDAKGMIVAPGIVDAHTHYDPQITFDPYATMSCYHGVTTVMAGNCGFSVAPCKKQDREHLTAIFARVEDMDPIAMSGITWDEFTTFKEFLDSRKGKLGVNFACYIGHSNLRRWVMGNDAIKRAATDAEIADMCAMVRDAMEAGAAGFSSSMAPTHLDIHDRPVPSRLAEKKEVLALVAEVGKAGHGSIAFLPSSAIGGITVEDQEYLIEIGQASGLPVIIQGLGGRNKVDAPTATWEASQIFLDDAVRRGGPVFSLLIARPFDRSLVIGPANLHYRAVPSWMEMLNLPEPERAALLRDANARETLRKAVENYNRDPAKGTTVPPPIWTTVFIDRVTDPAHKPLEGRSIKEVADEQGKAPADVILDLALAEDFKTEFRWRTESPEWRDAVKAAQLDPRMIVGTSDGGAHLAKDDGSDWSSYFLRSWVIDRGVWSLEEGVRQITQIPAALLGINDRGFLKVGNWADIMIFDPETIGPWKKEFVHDLPGGVGRVKAWGKGVKATIVNGQPIVMDGQLLSNLPGQVVRPN